MPFSGRSLLLAAVLFGTQSAGPAAGVNYCPPVWTQYQLKTGSFCYRLFGQPKTWPEAEATCRGYTLCRGSPFEAATTEAEKEKEESKTGTGRAAQTGGQGKAGLPEEGETAHLVSIGSAEEEDFVSSYWKEMRGPFVGEQGIWLGHHRLAGTPGSLRTRLDKLRAPYENWGALAGGEAAGECSRQVASRYAWPRWQRVRCDARQPFICKMHAL